jgi:hypothetical protein
MFEEHWCDRCERDRAFREVWRAGRIPDAEDGCPILANAVCFDIGDPDYPPQWRYGADGEPECTGFVAIRTSLRPPAPRKGPQMTDPLTRAKALVGEMTEGDVAFAHRVLRFLVSDEAVEALAKTLDPIAFDSERAGYPFWVNRRDRAFDLAHAVIARILAEGEERDGH